MAKAAGGELHTGCEAELGVAGKLGVGSAVLEKVLEGKVSLQRRDEVLGRDTVACVQMGSGHVPRARGKADAPASSKRTGT